MIPEIEYKNLCPHLERIHESRIYDESNGLGFIGWSSVFLDLDGIPLGGGFSTDRIKARRIGLAETIERETFTRIKDNQELNSELLLKRYPGTSGFAAGFDKRATILRSIAEALERWAWSKWIDESFLIPEIYIDKASLSKQEMYFARDFIDIKFFEKDFIVNLPFSGKVNFIFKVSLCLTRDGIFPGSRVSFKNFDTWEHPLIESWRHLRIYKSNKSEISRKDIINERIHYFAKNKDIALLQVSKASNIKWPVPILAINQEVNIPHPNVFVWRSLFDDFKSWHLGGKDRFVY